MEYAVILKFDFEEKTKLIRVQQSSKFEDIVNEVIGMWPILSSSKLGMCYFVGCIKNCSLSSDSDLVSLVEFCQISSEKLVQVSVCSTQSKNLLLDTNNSQSLGVCVAISDDRVDASALQTQLSNIPDNRVDIAFNHRQSNACSTEFTGLGSLPNFDICPKEKTKAYLSDNWGNIMKVGAVFGGAPEFRIELIKYSTKLNFKFIYVKNCPRYIYIYAECNQKVSACCEWFIKGKHLPMNSGFNVSKANLVHNCVGNLLNEKKNRFGTKIIKDILLQNVKSNPTITGKKVLEHINDDYGFEVPYWKAWYEVEAARNDIFGSYDESYDQLRWYGDAIKRTNPGSIVDIETNIITNHFERIFISFNACNEGFKSCRPMLFIDGTFMKGRSKGVLLAATAKDGNNGLFPVAFAIVSSENRNNWAWFLTKLRDLITHPKRVIYISNRNVGLMSAFYDVWNDPAHFYCLYHLLSNLKGRYGGGWNTQHRENMAGLFKECAYAPTITIFKEKLKLFTKVGGRIAEKWLENLHYARWAVSHSPHLKRYGEMTSNAAESFNSWIREVRSLPITHMIDSIRKKTSGMFVERREFSNKWTGLLVPSKETLWHELGNISASWPISLYPNGQFEVSSKTSVTVDLQYNICTCFEWQIKWFPCAHVVAVIKKHCTSIHSVVEECFFTSKYKQCYEVDLFPVPQIERFEAESAADSEKILPPILLKPPGRPKQKRITSYGEFPKIKSTICKRCGKKGRHDYLTCAGVFGTDKTNIAE